MVTDGVCVVGKQGLAESGESIDMEACFSQLTLDVIGKAVFNYDFDSLNTSSPLIQASCPHTSTPFSLHFLVPEFIQHDERFDSKGGALE